MSTIKISELATSNIALTDFFAKADATGLASKNTIQNLSTFFETIGEVGFKGSLLISDTPIIDGWYIAAENGTYTNAGGVVVTLLNTFNIIIVSSTQTVFELIEVPLTITVNGIIESGNIDAVSGGIVELSLRNKADFLNNKNIFISSNLITGSYINQSNGNISTNASYSYVKIPLLANTDYNYSVDDTNPNLEQFAFYDIDGVYISGNVGLAKTITFNTGSNIREIGLSVKNTDISSLYQLELGTSRSTYVEGKREIKILDLQVGEIDETYIKDGSNIVVKKPNKNIFNSSDLITGSFINQSNGNISTNASYSYIKIPLLENKDYNYSVDDTNPNLEQFAFYDIDGVYISGNVGLAKTITFNTGSNIREVGLSIKNTDISSLYQLETGTSRSTYVENAIAIPLVDIVKSGFSKDYFTDDIQLALQDIVKKILYCGITGNSDFANLRLLCESITDASKSNQYVIYLSEGEYDTTSWFTEAEILVGTFRGFEKPEWVSFVGVGNRNNIYFKGELDISIYGATVSARVSTIHLQGSGDLENIYVTAKNMQYAIHDDYNEVNLTRKIKNVKAHKFTGQGTTEQALGGGHRSGAYFEIIDNEFTTDFDGVPFSYHNNPTLAKGSVFDIYNNYFSSAFGEYAIRFGSLNSGVIEVVNLVGNRLNGKILLKDEVLNSGDGIDYNIQGYGNTIVPIEFLTSNTDEFTYNINEICASRINQNASTIVRGKLVKETASGDGFDAFLSTDSYSKFYGITLNESLSGAEGIVQTSGYFPIAFTSLTSLNIGDKIGITSGDLAVVTGAEYIGFVSNTNYIKIK